ncbi:MAG: helicase-related protein [Alphaproteobacteria bacterium]
MTAWTAPSDTAPVLAVLGPTNTGKTHFAVERMLAHRSGMIGFPLRLLAREIYDRVVAERGPRVTALITGEEKVIPEDPRYFICTVEAMPLGRQTEFLAVDEIQLATDPDRGHVFTQRLLGARGVAETLFLGSHTAHQMIRRLLPNAEIRTRPRLSRLSYAGPRKLSRLPPRTAVVAFSAEDVHDIAVALRRRRGGCAIVMGALSPRTRNAQVALYQSGDVDFLVATDAIGMGLNMDIDHVAFASIAKFDGRQNRRLTDAEIGQIAGRAGRYLRDGTFGATEPMSGFEQPLIDALEGHDFPPARAFQWRNGRPDTRTLGALLRSLDDPPPDPALLATPDAEDHLVLKLLAELPEIADMAADPEGVALLWEACQTPDFAQIGSSGHARLVARLFGHLRTGGAVPTDWIARHVTQLERTEGDIGTLLERIARIRTWTYLAHHGGWVPDAQHWQERTRGIEDRLSDALHDRLTDQFVDPYAVTSGRRRKRQEETVVAHMRRGGIWVGDERVGVVDGLRFVADPDSGLDADSLRRRTAGYGDTALARAVRRALREGMPVQVNEIVAAADDSFRLGTDGVIRWNGAEVALLKGDRDILAPAIHPAAADALEPADRDRLVARLRSWLDQHLEGRLGPLLALRTAALSGHGRGLAYQLVDGLGVLPRERVRAHMNGLSQAERKAMRDLGVNFGRYALSVPALAKPDAMRLRALLWCVHHGRPVPNLPARRGRSVPDDPAAPDGFYPAVGFVRVERRLIPVRLYDRLADAAASTLRRGRLTASPQMASHADLTLPELRQALVALGYRSVTDAEGEHYRPQRRQSGPPAQRARGGGREQSADAPEARAGTGQSVPDQSLPDQSGADQSAAHQSGTGQQRRRRRGRPNDGRNRDGVPGDAAPHHARTRDDKRPDDKRRDGSSPHGKGKDRDGKDRDGKGREGRGPGQVQQRPAPRPREIDPDSPFAVLRTLTFGDRKG